MKVIGRSIGLLGIMGQVIGGVGLLKIEKAVDFDAGDFQKGNLCFHYDRTQDFSAAVQR